jgi:large subunit ribosomal protein L6
MSRIGKSPISIPSGVEIKMDGNLITVKGAKGTLTQEFDPAITVNIEEGVISFNRASDTPDHRAKHGLYRALVSNMIGGVTEGYKKVLEVIGVGFRADAQGQVLTLSVGHSHPIIIEMPQEIKVSTETAKGKAPVIILESSDKQLVGHVAAKIRSFRKPEPYKGKGIRLQGEYVRRKAGKAAGK